MGALYQANILFYDRKTLIFCLYYPYFIKNEKKMKNVIAFLTFGLHNTFITLRKMEVKCKICMIQ